MCHQKHFAVGAAADGLFQGPVFEVQVLVSGFAGAYLCICQGVSCGVSEDVESILDPEVDAEIKGTILVLMGVDELASIESLAEPILQGSNRCDTKALNQARLSLLIHFTTTLHQQ